MEVKKNIWLIFVIVIICTLITVMTIMFIFKRFDLEVEKIKQSQLQQNKEAKLTNQFLLSTIDWSTRRQKMILFMRDQIIERRKSANLPISVEKAYLIAERNIYECEKYPSVDPMLLLATQNIESAFNDSAVSSQGAMGLNQVMPSTARLLCFGMGLTYRDKMLFDINTNDKMAIRLLDILFATYSCPELVLADYNGGPYSAYYYQKDKSKLSIETAKYVPAVMSMWNCYKSKFENYRIDSVYAYNRN